MGEQNEQGRIPVVIGVTGHRDLRPEEIPALREAVKKELCIYKAMYPASPFVMLSSLAEGADQLCAETALEEGYSLAVPLPMEFSEYEKDFAGEALKKLHELIAAADTVFVCPAAEPAPDSQAYAARQEAVKPASDISAEAASGTSSMDAALSLPRSYYYRQAGIYTAEHCQVLLALWDGKPGMPGGCGTAETVDIKLRRTFDEKYEESLHPDNGCVIRIFAGRVSGFPCGDAGKTEFLGSEDWLRQVLEETDRFNAAAAGRNAAEGKQTTDSLAERSQHKTAAVNGQKESEDAVLSCVQGIYDAADRLSIENAGIYKQVLRALSAAATFLTIAFLLYDEAEMHWMILLCGLMLIALLGVRLLARRLRCHKNYLEYRLLAEGLRVQQYLRTAGLVTEAAELLPWSLQINAPWIKEACEAAMIGPAPENAAPVLDLWVRDQKKYHLSAGKKTNAQIRRNDRIVRTALILSSIAYAAALLFEVRCGGLLGGTLAGGAAAAAGQAGLAVIPIETFRTVLKILLGGLSASTLFAGNYYGKLSLEETEDDHARMARLYETAERKILEEGENPELLLKLAKEELGENSSWYAYQSMNKPEISL